MPRPPSAVHSLFTRKAGTTYSCNICGKCINASELTKSNLNRHIKRDHPEQDLSQRHGAGGGGPGSMRAFAGSARPRGPQMGRDSPGYKEISAALTRFVASSYSSLAVVDNADFRAFVTALNPAYPVPSRPTLRKQLLDASVAAQDGLRRAIRGLARDRSVALTMDLWSNRQLMSYIGMTLHLAEEGGLRTHLLCFRRFPERHTGANILDAYEQVVVEYGLQGRVSVLVTDSAANMLKAFRAAFNVPSAAEGDDEELEDNDDDELQVERLDEIDDGMELTAGSPLPRRVSCCAHTLQLVIRDALRVCGSQNSGVSRAMARLQSFIGAARHSSLGMEILKKAQCSLAAPNATRWNSQLRAVESFLRLQDPVLGELRQLEKLRTKCPTEGDRVILTEVCSTLGPFSAATDLLQGDRVVTASHVVPTLVGLRCALTSSPQPTTSAARQLREELAKSLERRFAATETDPLYITATILDPRFKLLPWTSQGACVKEVQDACLEYIEAELRKRPLVTGRTPSGGAPGPAAASASTSQSVAVDVVELNNSSDEDDPMRAAARSRTPGAGSTTGPATTASTSSWGSKTSLYDFMRGETGESQPIKSPIEKEFETYMMEPILDQGADPLLYWNGRRTTYPHLRVAALNALTVPASSGPSERIFSMSGRMFSPSRSRLSADMAEALMHVRCQ